MFPRNGVETSQKFVTNEKMEILKASAIKKPSVLKGLLSSHSKVISSETCESKVSKLSKSQGINS